MSGGLGRRPADARAQEVGIPRLGWRSIPQDASWNGGTGRPVGWLGVRPSCHCCTSYSAATVAPHQQRLPFIPSPTVCRRSGGPTTTTSRWR